MFATIVIILSGLGLAPAPGVVAETGPSGVSITGAFDFSPGGMAAWEPDRAVPSGGWGSTSFAGRDDVLGYGIDHDDPTATPSQSAFYRTEGLKSTRDLGTSVSIELFVDPAWADHAVRAGLWVAGWHETGRSGEFAIIEFTTAEPVGGVFENMERWRIWSSDVGWVDVTAPIDYGTWVDLRIELDLAANEYNYFIGDALVATRANPSSTTVTIGEVFLNSYNYHYEDFAAGFSGASYDVHWHNLTHAQTYTSIRAAVDAAAPGDVIDIGPGTYDEGTSFWQIGKSVTLRGAGSDLVTIDRRAAPTYGVVVTGPGITLEGFTFLGPQTGSIQFGLKIQFASDLVLRDVVVRDSGRTGIDLNTVNGATLVGVQALDNGGAGIALRNAQGVLVQGAVADGNAWGGLAFWALAGETLSGVTVTNSTFTNQVAGIFAQHPGSYSNITVAGNRFIANGVQVTDQTGVGAVDLEQALAENDFDRSVVVRVNPIVVPAIFSSIQDAVDAASTGETVLVGPGTYVENVVVAKDLALLSSAGRAETIIEGSPGALGTVVLTGGTGNARLGDIDQGFTVRGSDSANPALESAAVYLQGAMTNTTIVGNEIVAEGEAALLSEWGQSLSGLVITDNVFSGKTFVGDEPAGQGTGQQFSLWNVPRQLVAIGHGGGASGFLFARNIVNGTTGGLNAGGLPQGNTVLTMDAGASAITENIFNATTMWSANVLRARGNGVLIAGNGFQSGGLTVDVNHVFLGAATAAVTDVGRNNSFERGAYAETSNFISLGVQRSLDVADPGGDTVHVFAGVHEEALTVKTSGLSLLGANVGEAPGSATRGPESVIHAGSAPAVSLAAGVVDLSVAGFTLEGTHGVRMGNVPLASDLNVSSNFITATIPGAGSGVRFNGGPGSLDLAQNVVSGFANGAIAERGSVVATGNTFNASGKGVYLLPSVGSATLQENTFSGNVFGAYVWSDGASIAGNTFSGNDIGVWVREASGVAIDGNLIEGNVAGIQDEGAGNSARMNRIVGNGLGVSATGSAFDARENWWGQLTGPALSPLTGTNGVAGPVDFAPWCLDETCSGPLAPSVPAAAPAPPAPVGAAAVSRL